MTLRHLDGLQTLLRAPDGVDSGAPADGPLGFAQGLALYQAASEAAPKDDSNDDAPATPPGGAAQEESAPDDGADAAAGDDQPPGETDEPDDTAPKEPAIDPPRSWTREEKADFAKLPRETQERLAEREQQREADFRRRQNDAASEQKALEADRRAAAEQAKQATEARQRYEQGVEQYFNAATSFLAGNFADVKTWDDARKLALEDPIRYNEWNVVRQQAEAAQNELNRQRAENARAAEEEKRKRQHEGVESFKAYVKAEQDKFLAAAPEFADLKRAPQLQAETRAMLIDDFGVTPEELKALWVDGAPMSFHEFTGPALIRDALLYRKAKKAVAGKPAQKPVPQVQKPGTPPAKGEAESTRLRQLDTELTRTGSRKAGLALIRELSRPASR